MPIDIKRGDIFDVDWNPSRGSEQGGLRPALVIQSDNANVVKAYPVVIVLAISSKLKRYKSNVEIKPTNANGLSVVSEVNTGQIITIDKDRLGRHRGRLSAMGMAAVDQTLSYMLGLSE